MNPETFIQMQQKMKENQSELQSYLKDLESWESDIKTREASTVKSGVKAQSTEIPIRNSHLTKKKKKKRKETTEVKGPKRISSYDYRSWDKFDVDKACKDVDGENAAHTSSGSETDEEWEEQRRKQQALVLKDQGNQYLAAGQYTKAVECYTRGIESDGSNAVLYANRAMALLKQEKYAAAEGDCTIALGLDPSYVKAYFRRASARGSLSRHSEAAEDLKRLLSLDAGNREAKTELARLEKLMQPAAVTPRFSALEPSGDTGIVTAIYKPLELRSKKPLRRLTIEEVGKPKDTKVHKTRDAKAEENFLKFTSASNKSDLDSQSQVNGHAAPAGGRKIEEVSPAAKVETLKDSEPDAGVAQKAATAAIVSHTAVASTSTPANVTMTTVPPVPTTSYQFQLDWKRLKTSPQQLYTYFRAIPTQSYVRLIGESLDDDIFCSILTLLDEFYTKDSIDVIAVLQAMTSVKRFATILLFLDAKYKQVLKRVFDAAATTATSTAAIAAELNVLKSKYGL